MVIDPWGGIVAQKESGPGLLMAEIDRNETARARRQMPSLEHRRL
jgi:nitrilase